MATPYRLGFESSTEIDTNRVWSWIDATVDILFGIDLILNFFFAYYNSEEVLITNHKKIASTYLKSWFFIDLISILPFDKLFEIGDFNSLGRIIKLPKLYKLIKMTRLVRMLKILKERSKLVKYLQDLLSIGVGCERLLFFILLFLVICHIVSCLWVVAARFDETDPDTWIIAFGYNDLDDWELYFISFYFTVTTITTVGFGDISATNSTERIICVVLMLIGVISFSFATSQLTSILFNYDSSQAKLKEKIATLNEIKKEYLLEPELYDQLRSAIRYDHSMNYKDQI